MEKKMNKQEPKKKRHKYNPVAKELYKSTFQQRIKQPKSPSEDGFNIQKELDEYYSSRDKKK